MNDFLFIPDSVKCKISYIRCKISISIRSTRVNIQRRNVITVRIYVSTLSFQGHNRNLTKVINLILSR